MSHRLRIVRWASPARRHLAEGRRYPIAGTDHVPKDPGDSGPMTLVAAV